MKALLGGKGEEEEEEEEAVTRRRRSVRKEEMGEKKEGAREKRKKKKEEEEVLCQENYMDGEGGRRERRVEPCDRGCAARERSVGIGNIFVSNTLSSLYAIQFFLTVSLSREDQIGICSSPFFFLFFFCAALSISSRTKEGSPFLSQPIFVPLHTPSREPWCQY